MSERDWRRTDRKPAITNEAAVPQQTPKTGHGVDQIARRLSRSLALQPTAPALRHFGNGFANRQPVGEVVVLPLLTGRRCTIDAHS